MEVCWPWPAGVVHRTVTGRFQPSGEKLVHSVSVLSLNARSLLSKIDELVALCLATSPDIVCIIETWLSPETVLWCMMVHD